MNGPLTSIRSYHSSKKHCDKRRPDHFRNILDPWSDDMDAVDDAANIQSADLASPPLQAVKPSISVSKPRKGGEERQLSWSAYMGEDADDGDSPWASLDAIADGTGHLAKPFPDSAGSRGGVNEGEDALMKAAVEAALSSSSKQNLPPREPSILGQVKQDSAPAANDSPARLSHVDPATGSASMVDVSSKATTTRTAEAVGRVTIPWKALPLLEESSSLTPTHLPSGANLKGPVLHTAQLAGIMGAKRTADLVPLCHSLPLSHVDVSIRAVQDDEEAELPYLLVRCTATTAGQTGVEMEALTGVQVACLTLWDMLKSVAGRDMVISGIMVTSKRGGKSGDWDRKV